MNADGKFAPGGETQLGEKNLLLLVVGQSGFPSIEPDLTNRTWPSVELLLEPGQPVRGAFGDKPWVQTKTGYDLRMLPGQLGYHVPVRFAGSVDDHSNQPGLRAFGEHRSGVVGEAVIL